MQKRDFLKMLGSAAIAAPLAGAIASSAQKENIPLENDTFNTTFRRMEESGVMVCGYIDYKIYCFKDPLTGKMSGIFYDMTEMIAANAGYNTKWVETTYATLAEDLKRGKFDVFCGGLWPSINEAKVLRYSMPAFFAGLGIYARKEDTRFGKGFDVKRLDDPRYTFATIDGEMSQIVHMSDFAKAKTISMPSSTDITQLPLSVTTGKADVTIIENAVAQEFMLHNPDTLVNIAEGKPVRLFENTFAFAHNEPILKDFFDVAMKELIFSGIVQKLVTTYAPSNNSFLLPNDPFKKAS